MALSVSYKPFGEERGKEIGRVLIIDPELVAGDPSAAASAGGAGRVTVVLTPAVGDSPGITDLGYKTRREAEAIAKRHGVPLSEH